MGPVQASARVALRKTPPPAHHTNIYLCCVDRMTHLPYTSLDMLSKPSAQKGFPNSLLI